MKDRGMIKINKNKGYEKFQVKIRGAKISMENLRGAKISVENLRGMKKFHHSESFRKTLHQGIRT